MRLVWTWCQVCVLIEDSNFETLTLETLLFQLLGEIPDKTDHSITRLLSNLNLVGCSIV